jgi:hypothetical protein
MKYRTYISRVNTAATILIALGLAACAAPTADRKSESVQKDTSEDGREPASMLGNFSWLNEVEDDFGRIAAETSSRAVASQNQHEVLMKFKDWSFSFLPKTNHFYVALQGTHFQMVQTKIDDGERFAFAAEGQAENPLTFSVTRGEGRTVASGTSNKCVAEISFWNKRSKSYVTEHKAVEGKPCERLLSLLKDYVP